MKMRITVMLLMPLKNNEMMMNLEGNDSSSSL